MIYIHTVYIYVRIIIVCIYIYIYTDIILSDPTISDPIHSVRRKTKHHFQEAVDIVLKFPNPSDAADALVKDRLSFRSEELIEIWTLLLF